jgi:hypothetical protein
LIEVVRGKSTAWILKTQRKGLAGAVAGRPLVRLLPAYDTYLLGTRDRDLLIAPRHAKRIFPGGGLVHPAVTLNGRVLGTWRVRRGRGGIEVILEAFERLPLGAGRALESEVEDLGRFLGAEATPRMVRAYGPPGSSRAR